MVETQISARMAKECPSLEASKILPDGNGRLYVRVIVQHIWDGKPGQRSSRYFVRVADGAIFACEGWKKPNFNRQFGTLDTIDQFDWSGFEGRALPDSSFTMKMVPGGSGYMTAVPK
jgi:hypothetical protein